MNKTAAEIVEHAIAYDAAEHEGFVIANVESVRLIALAAVRADRAQMIQEFEGAKGAIFHDGEKIDSAFYGNAGLYIAQKIVREAE